MLLQLTSYLFPRSIETRQSVINGTITVELSRGEKRLRVGGYTQSGRYTEHVFNCAFHNISARRPIRSILLLGLGGGSMILPLVTNHPKATITAVELDPEMIYLGKKHFHLSIFRNLRVVIGDATGYIHGTASESYDCIIDDMFIGCDRPASADSLCYVHHIHRILAPGGIYVCNRSFLPRYKPATDTYVSLLSSHFTDNNHTKQYPNFLIRARKT